ncbi:MAG TPA: hypothetical protein VJR30_15975 [Bradyrhizobium sp.]|nr:hypothetical protein [Bradyrhizobium sp.]
MSDLRFERPVDSLMPSVRFLAFRAARKNVVSFLIILLAVFAGGAYSYFSGEDINWDWRNYHEYGAFAVLNGRFDIDVAPGGFQTFLNPIVYVPAYILRHFVGPPFWGVLLGAIHGLNLIAVYWLARTLLRDKSTFWTIGASLAIAATGPMTLSEVGTSFADILTSIPIIAAVLLILVGSEKPDARLILAGILMGGAVGLKLTNATYLIGAIVSLLFASRALLSTALFAVGSAIGGIITGGAWAFFLWKQFGNPVFPFYNSIFRSPEAPLGSIADVRFLPRSVLDAALYPFYWLIGDHRSSEWAFRDPRFATAFVLMFILVIVARYLRADVFGRRDKQFIVFFFSAYGTWLFMFAIHRYAIGLELLVAPLIVLLLSKIIELIHPRKTSTAALPFVFFAFAIVAWSQPADWFRRSWSDPYRPHLPHALLQPATFLLVEKPIGYVVPILPTGSRSYQLSDIVMPIVPGGALDERIRRGLSNPLAGGVWALHLKGSQLRHDLINPYGWEIDPSRSCEFISGADHLDIEACPLQRAAQ